MMMKVLCHRLDRCHLVFVSEGLAALRLHSYNIHLPPHNKGMQSTAAEQRLALPSVDAKRYVF